MVVIISCIKSANMHQPSISTAKGKSASTRRRSKMKYYNSFLMNNPGDPLFSGLPLNSSDDDEGEQTPARLRTKRARAGDTMTGDSHFYDKVHDEKIDDESDEADGEDSLDRREENSVDGSEDNENGNQNDHRIEVSAESESNDNEDESEDNGNKSQDNKNDGYDNEDESENEDENEDGDESEDDDDKSQDKEDNSEESIAELDQICDSTQRSEEGDDKPFLNSNLCNLITPLTFKRHVTAKDNLLATIAMSIRYNTTYDMILSMLKWIDTSTHDSHLPKSKRALWSAFRRNDEAVKRHLYCSECRDCIGQGKIITRRCCCGACDPDNIKNSNVAYFLEISLREQLTELLSIPGIANELNYKLTRKRRDLGAVEDIYDSEQYINLCQPGLFLGDPFNFTYKFYTDGARISKSSNASAWPIFIEINELHPHARKRHIMLAGIWVDCKHPIANIYFWPFVQQANEIYANGIRWKPDGINKVTSKFMPVIFCADSGARWDCLGMTQFNGAFGCTFCYIPGIVLPGKSKQSKYSVEDNSKCRTDEEIRRNGKEALAANQKVYGVQGPSAFTALPGFNMASGVIVDCMHNVYMGVYKQHLLLLLEDYGSAYYIGSPEQVNVINKRLKTIKLPSRVSRKPRDLTFVKQFKASEWRNWGYYGLQCLEGVLPPKYHRHLALLFEASYILNKDSIIQDDIKYADELITKYRHLFQKYFGLQRMTYNIHLLKHLCDTVRHWGPFWVHSAFTFESMNKRIMDSVTSSNGPAWQIYTRFMMRKFINNTVYDASVSEETKQFISEMLHINPDHCNADADGESSTTFKGLGRETSRPPHDWEIRGLQAASYNCAELIAYQKAWIHGIEYRCVDFKPNTKFQNSIVYCDNDGFGEILSIVVFHSDNERIEGILLRRLMDQGQAFGTKFITDVSITQSVVFVNTHSMRAPAFVVNTSGGLRATRLPNVWESD